MKQNLQTGQDLSGTVEYTQVLFTAPCSTLRLFVLTIYRDVGKPFTLNGYSANF